MIHYGLLEISKLTGSSAVWQRTAFGTLGSEVQILSPRLDGEG